MGLVFLVLLVGYVFFRLQVQSEWNDAVEALRAQGHPTSLDELAQRYPPPMKSKAAELLLRAHLISFDLDRYPSTIDEEQHPSYLVPFSGAGEAQDLGQKFDPKIRRMVVDFLDKNKKTRALIHEAAALGKARFVIHFQARADIPMEHLSILRSHANLLALEALIHAEQDQGKQAARSIEAIAKLGQMLQDEPFLITHLVKLALKSLAVDVFERTVNLTELSPEDLERLGRHLEKSVSLDGLAHALIEDRVLTLTELKSPNISESIDQATWLKYTGLWEVNLLNYLEASTDYIKAAKKPFPDRLDALELIDQSRDADSDWAELSNIVNEHVLFSHTQLALIEMRTVAALRCARAAVGVLLYRQRTGRLPDSLEALRGRELKTIPSDPFVHGTVRYKKFDSGGFTIWSVGEDRTDNQGADPRIESNWGDPGTDYPFHWRRTDLPPRPRWDDEVE